ncbi:MAG TPA: nucleoside 2-deoxyribosyltransferase domain-containing protein [Pseudonocardiaceae bacterium]|nr:nucleoside 2-deoxyribosyltransferase domain-containing protein [Pseudonocardiaceae bacterium]
MRCVEAPEPYQPRAGDGPVVFLAGGITAVPDWQATVVDALRDEPFVLLNPRRSGSDVLDPGVADEQIAWEHRHLWLPELTLTLFWFAASDPAVTVQPIALYELGAAAAAASRRIVVGADPGYPRRHDVRTQLRLARPELVVHQTLPDVITEVRAIPR